MPPLVSSVDTSRQIYLLLAMLVGGTRLPIRYSLIMLGSGWKDLFVKVVDINLFINQYQC